MIDPQAINNPQLLMKKMQQRFFVAFLLRAWPHVTGGELISWNWHLDAIAYQLERIANGKSRRLIVNLPPRNGKSKLISIIWIAFMLGQYPRLGFVCVSYSNELSSKLARDCLSIMESDWYQHLFPATKISKKRSATGDFETTLGGGRLATSVTGTLTGRGGDIIILDDVIKPEEALSEVTRNNVNQWYQSTLSSRLNDKGAGAILCVMQRLHEYDLTGMLLETGGWDHLSLPAIAIEDANIPLTRGKIHHRKEGDLLHPSRESRSVLGDMKAAMGSHAFNAQYQQDPMPAEGNLFHSNWLMRFELATVGRPGEILQSWDTANKTGLTNDYSVCITALVSRRDVFILNVWRGRLEFPDLHKKTIELAKEFRPSEILIEDKASGQQLLQALRADNISAMPRPLARSPENDKVTRAAGVSSMVEAGHLYLPSQVPWLEDFEHELLAFPNARHDDQVDALSQLLERVRQKSTWTQSSSVAPTVPDPNEWQDDADPNIDPWLGE